MAEILEKAQELANALQESFELQNVRAKEKLVQADPAAKVLMDGLRATQMEYYNLQMEGGEPSEELVSKLKSLQEEMEDNSILMDYMEAQETLGKVLQQVNIMISQALSEGEGCSGTECSSCAGCN